jgi:hypothetical protein
MSNEKNISIRVWAIGFSTLFITFFPIASHCWLVHRFIISNLSFFIKTECLHDFYRQSYEKTLKYRPRFVKKLYLCAVKSINNHVIYPRTEEKDTGQSDECRLCRDQGTLAPAVVCALSDC